MRTENPWQILGGGTYLSTTSVTGYDVLINGTSKYLNFNSLSGSTGYGFRDNSGTMEFKNSGGSWAAFASPAVTSILAGSGITVSSPTGDVTIGLDYDAVGGMFTDNSQVTWSYAAGVISASISDYSSTQNIAFIQNSVTNIGVRHGINIIDGTGVTVTMTDQPVFGQVDVTIAIGQSVATSATPQFARLGLGIAANASYRLTMGDGTNTTSANGIYFGDSVAVMYRSAASTITTDAYFVAKRLTLNSSYAAPLDGDLSIARNNTASGYIYLGNGGDRYIGYSHSTQRFALGNSWTVMETGFAILSTTQTNTSSTPATIKGYCSLLLENPSSVGQTYVGASFNGTLKSAWRFDYAGNINYSSTGYHAFYVQTSTFEDTFSCIFTTTGVAIGQYANPPGGQLGVYNQSASRVGLYVKGAASQSANLLTLDNSSASAMFTVGATGIVTLSAAFREKVVTVTDGAGAVIDASLGNVFNWTAAADRTAGTTTNPVDGQKIIIRFTASGGARTLTLPTATTGDFRFGTDITTLTATTSGKTDYIGCVYNSTRWDVVAYTKGF